MNENKLKNTIRELVQFLWRVDKTVVFSIIGISLIEAGLPFAGISLSAYVLDGLQSGRDRDQMLQTVVLVVCGICICSIVKGFARKLFEIHEEICVRKFEMEMSSRTLTMDYELLDSPVVTEIRNRIKNDEDWGFDLWYVIHCGAQVIQNSLSLLFSVCILITMFAGQRLIWNPVMYLLIAGAVGIMTFSSFFSVKKRKEVYALMDKVPTVGDFLDYFLYNKQDYRQGKDIRTYEGQKIIESYMDRSMEKKESWVGQASRIEAQRGFSNGISSGLLQGMAYLFVTLQAAMGVLSIGSLMKYAATVYRFFQAFQGMLAAASEYALSVKRQQSTIEYMHVPDVLYKGSLPVEKRFFCEDGDNDYEIEFKHVSFRYPSASQYALKDFSFKFRTGERLAVVGKNGSGKTTFIKLLCRLYDPTEGEILLNGVNIKKYDQEEYRRIFSVVFQDFKIFSFSIAQNVASSVDYDKERVISCLRKAGFGERLSELSDGVETFLYKNFDEDGVEISGGEAQKLALARALYKDAPFMILDEPTAALDPIAEYDIYRRFHEIVDGKTAIYISHRLSSCRFCDDIAVFDEGRLVQRGNHETLVADREGTYYELWQAQAKYYTEEKGENR